MSRRIIKFAAPPGVSQMETADEPTFRAVAWQGDHVVVWVEAEPGVGVSTGVVALTTGEAAPDPGDAEYVGTAVSSIVVHVYRERRSEGGTR